jgi:cytochrome c oxidase cbb3-type subunit 3
MSELNMTELDKEKKDLKKTPETTGHEWDGIREYNVPAPRWWLIVWIICIIWAFIYWVFYPTWPTKSGNSKGRLNWSGKSQLNLEEKEAALARNVYLTKFAASSFEEIQKDPQLLEFALTGGHAAFKENCAACHGNGAQGGKGFPNLNDDDWLWGGKIEDIYTTLKYGIRSFHATTRASQMPSFGVDKLLTKEEIENVANYVISLSDQVNSLSVNAKGAEIFKNNCASCHGFDAKGSQAVGAPNLTDKIWLYGASKEDIKYTIFHARNGVMPYFHGRLDDNTIRQLALYIHSLGGGQ